MTSNFVCIIDLSKTTGKQELWNIYEDQYTQIYIVLIHVIHKWNCFIELIDRKGQSHFALTEAVSLLSGVKLDPATMKHDASKMPAVPPHPKSASSSITDTRTPSAKTRVTSSSLRQVKTPATLKTYEMPIQPLVCLLETFSSKYSSAS